MIEVESKKFKQPCHDLYLSTKKDKIQETARVYASGPVGELFTTQNELDKLLERYNFIELSLHRNDQGLNYVSLTELLHHVEGARSLYHIEFLEHDADRIRKVWCFEVNSGQILLTSNASNCPLFVVHEEKESNCLNNYFQMALISPNPVLQEAIELATAIIKTDRYCRVIFDCNREDYTINQAQIEFSDQKLKQTNTMAPTQNVRCNKFQSLESFQISDHLVQLTEKIAAGGSIGRNRVIYFAAVAIIYESTRWKHFLYRCDNVNESIFVEEEEEGLCFEQQFLGGVLELKFDLDSKLQKEDDITLRIVANKEHVLIISSPELATSNEAAESDQLSTPVISKEKVELVISQIETREESPSSQSRSGYPSARFKWVLINRGQRDIYLPSDESNLPLVYLAIICHEVDQSGKIVKTLRSRFHHKTKLQSLIAFDQKRVAPNERVTYIDAGDLNFYYDIEWGKIYKVDFRFTHSLCYNGYTYRYNSNTIALEIRTFDTNSTRTLEDKTWTKVCVEFNNSIVKFGRKEQ